MNESKPAEFAGFPVEMFSFYERLEADNSKAFWQANKPVFDEAVRAPTAALLAELAPVYGEFHTFRPHRDVRFSKDKTPYKTSTGSVAESEGGTMFYVETSASGLRTGAGFYSMAKDQLERFRNAADDDHRGRDLAKRCAAMEKRGYTLGAIGELKTAPRGFPKDHPRIELIRRKGLIVMQHWEIEAWVHTREVKQRLTSTWKSMAPVYEWLETHVGPSELAPEEAGRW
ncbi:MAG: DUF2461 domain-containing protein [Ilumatobacteraceae bacterium]